jgi:hypothetical protein
MKSPASIFPGVLILVWSWCGAVLPLPLQAVTVYSTPEKVQQDVRISKDSRVRLGSNSAIEHTRKKNIRFKKGVLLVDDASRLAGRGTSVETSETTTSVRGGTFVAEYQEGGYLKIICLAGRVLVVSKSLFAEFIELTPGKMLIVSPADKKLPDPVDIDLQRFITSSKLLDGSEIDMANRGKTLSAVARQNGDDVTRTPVLIAGRGLGVSMDYAHSAGSPAFIEASKNGDAVDGDIRGAKPTRDDPTRRLGRSEGRTPRSDAGTTPPPATPGGEVIDYVLNSSTVIDPDGGSIQTSGFPELVMNENGEYRANNLRITGFVDLTGVDVPLRLRGEGTLEVGGAEAASILLGNGGQPVTFDTNGTQTIAYTTFDVGSGSTHEVTFRSRAGNIKVDDSSLTANDIEMLALTGCVWLTNSTVDARDAAGGSIGIRAGIVDFYNAQVGATQAPDNINLEGTELVIITNSSELRALAALTINSPSITIADSHLQVANGNLNLTAGNLLDLTNVAMSAQNVNLAVTAPGGLMHIKGGTISASQLLSLYANAGTIRFSNGAVSLNGQSINITAQTVEIDSDTTVTNTASGGTTVNATNRNFNKPGYGSFSNPPP